MSLVDAARRLADKQPIEDSDNGLRCMHCHVRWYYSVHSEHRPHCPWLALPQGEAALEAAEATAGRCGNDDCAMCAPLRAALGISERQP